MNCRIDAPNGSATIEIFARLQRLSRLRPGRFRSATIEIFARLQHILAQ